MEELTPTKNNGDVLTEEEFLQGLTKMGNGKACGPDNIPADLYKRSPLCARQLYDILSKIWTTEEVPTDFARATFVMLYKHKGSSDDPSKYRCIGLLNHSYKVLSQCLLQRLETETGGYLSDWQAGFRKSRGCRDNILTLRTLLEDVLDRGRQVVATFIDYSG